MPVHHPISPFRPAKRSYDTIRRNALHCRIWHCLPVSAPLRGVPLALGPPACHAWVPGEPSESGRGAPEDVLLPVLVPLFGKLGHDHNSQSTKAYAADPLLLPNFDGSGLPARPQEQIGIRQVVSIRRTW